MCAAWRVALIWVKVTDQLTSQALASLHYPSFAYILLKIIFTTGFTCPTYCIKLLYSSMSLSSRFLSQIENVQRQFKNQWSVLVCYLLTTTFQFFMTLEKFLPSSGLGFAAAFALPTTQGFLINLTQGPMTLTRIFLLIASGVNNFQRRCFTFVGKGLWKHRSVQRWRFTYICINLSLKIQNVHFHCLPSKGLHENWYMWM